MGKGTRLHIGAAVVIAALAQSTRVSVAATPAASPSAATALPERTPAEAADQANTPLPTQTQLAFKPAYTFPNGDNRYKAELLFEPTLPYRAFFVPGFQVAGFWSIARLQLTAESLQDESGPASGLSDLTLTDIVAHRFGPINVALGFATVFPMATNPALGQGKWQIGPAAALRVEGLWHLKVAVLVQQFYSVAGSSQSPDVAYVTVQPFVTVHLPAALFLSSDATMNFYEKGGRSTLPVNLGFGHAFGSQFVGSLVGWYTVADADRGDVEVQIVLDFQP